MARVKTGIVRRKKHKKILKEAKKVSKLLAVSQGR